MDNFIHFFDRYSLTVMTPLLGYANRFQNASDVVFIGALLAPMLALQWFLPVWAFALFCTLLLVGIAWLVIRLLAACVDGFVAD